MLTEWNTLARSVGFYGIYFIRGLTAFGAPLGPHNVDGYLQIEPQMSMKMIGGGPSITESDKLDKQPYL